MSKSSIFRFKQFSIQQEYAAMKIGTDGVLLGAWANIHNAKTILDIGTGTGVIALMCAQRNPTATISSVEMDALAVKDAQVNFNNSLWKKRIHLIHGEVQQFASNPIHFHQFDHIICNPPFFKVNRQLSNNRKMARQHASLSPADLSMSCKKLLHPSGKVSIIYPSDGLNDIIAQFKDQNLFVHRRIMVHGRHGIAAKRGLIEFGQHPANVREEQLIIEKDKRHDYTKEYIDLTKDFYLNM